MTKNDIICIISQDKWMINILQTVRTLNLPDWWIGAGFIRSKIWDTLHGYTQRTPLPDIDIIYFDPTDFTTEEATKFSTKKEIQVQNQLKEQNDQVNWSVTNQARMHLFHKHPPYKNAEDALSHWLETATCIGCQLNTNNQIILTAPWGIEDLVNLIIRPSPAYKEYKKTFQKRIKQKEWLKKWPKLKLVT